jgi:hypothetical protein
MIRSPVEVTAMRGSAFVLLAMYALVGGAGAAAAQGPPPSAPEVPLMPAREVRRLQLERQPVVLVDVRTREEYLARHITGALSAPLRELEAQAREVPRTGLVVLY